MPDAPRTTHGDLIARTAKGDRHAFDALYQASSARLNAVCLSILRDRREAEEALEQTYIRIWKTARDQPGSGLSPMAWLTMVARDQAQTRRRDATLPADADPLQPGEAAQPDEALRLAWLQGLDVSAFAARAAIPQEAARQRLAEGLAGMVAGDAAGDPADDLLAGELAAGFLPDGPDAQAARARAASDPAFAARLTLWQERLAGLAQELTPVMAPARARQRIRESLGHGAAPLSVDPLERAPWWRGPRGILVAILLAAAAWVLWGR